MLDKEHMLRQGRIYWSGVNRTAARIKVGSSKLKKASSARIRKVRRRLAAEPRISQKPQKRGLIEKILFHPKNK